MHGERSARPRAPGGRERFAPGGGAILQSARLVCVLCPADLHQAGRGGEGVGGENMPTAAGSVFCRKLSRRM